MKVKTGMFVSVVAVLAMCACPAFATNIPNRMWEYAGAYGIGSASQAMTDAAWTGPYGLVWHGFADPQSDALEAKKYGFRRTMDLTVSRPTYNYDYDAGAPAPSVACGGGFNGTDADPLVVQMVVDDYTTTGYQKANLFVEMSNDSDFAPTQGDATLHSSVAFGWYTALNSNNSSAAKYFDGLNWVDTKTSAPSMWPGKRGNTYTMTIKTNTIDLELNSKTGDYTRTITRQYLGAFNQINLTQFVAGEKPMDINQVKITGGTIVPEPVTALLCTGLLPLFWHRRRRQA